MSGTATCRARSFSMVCAMTSRPSRLFRLIPPSTPWVKPRLPPPVSFLRATPEPEGVIMRANLSARLRRSAAVVFAIVAVAGAAWAHHGWSNYDEKRVLDVTGVIREAGYENPHGFARLEVEGKVWYVVLAPPSRM